MTTAFIALQAEAASTGIAAATENYMDSGSIGKSNKTLSVANSVFTSDDFNNCTLDTDLWTFLNPASDGSLAMNGTQVILSVPSGTTHTVWGTGPGDFVNSVPKIRQPMNGTGSEPFTLTAKFDKQLNLGYEMEGILVEQDELNLLRFDFLHDGANPLVRAVSFINGAATVEHQEIIPSSSVLYMQVQRNGNDWTQSYSTNGTSWTDMSSFFYPMTVTSTSVYVGNVTVSNMVPIDFFYDADNPGPGDVNTNTLQVPTVGQGSVSKDPDKSGYDCNEVVELEAIPATGWSFSDWSGDVISTANPISLTITSSHVVTATFIQDEYTLTINLDGDGSVDKTPNQSTYHYSDVVTLTAKADPGWTFSEWSGDASGSSNPVQVTIDGNKEVTATFTQDEYTLDVNTVGDGQVTVDPTGPYLYSDVVTLAATADPGWTFSNWSGDVISTANPISLTITSSHVVTATFIQDEYTLTINLDGDGSVDKTPNQSTYHYSDVVTLTAKADPGWTFSEWSGDASGSSNPVQVTIDGNKEVTATFIQDEYRIYIPTLSN